jgi:anti-anti-sigma factor
MLWPPTTTQAQEEIMLTVTTQTVADTVALHCNGRLVRGEESALLCAAVCHHGRDVVLDLAQVTAIDAAGIGALVSLQAAGVYLKLANPTVAVRDVLKLTAMESVFEITEEPAKSVLRASPDAHVYVGQGEVPALG